MVDDDLFRIDRGGCLVDHAGGLASGKTLRCRTTPKLDAAQLRPDVISGVLKARPLFPATAGPDATADVSNRSLAQLGWPADRVGTGYQHFASAMQSEAVTTEP